MTRTMEQCERFAFEAKLLAKYMSDFRFYDPRGDTYVEGWVRTTDGQRFQLRIDVPPQYPYEKPPLYVVEPNTLWRYGDNDTVNSLGRTHSFHTLSNGPDGCVQICHTRDWNASMTLLKVVLKGILWVEAYTAHLQSGRDLADYLARPAQAA